MAAHQNPCVICESIALCSAGTHHGYIMEMETGYAVLGDSQYLPGYSVLLCKTPVTELDELPRDARLKYLEEMALLAQAVRGVVKPHKMNYECLGNVAHHLHWHVFPRLLSEPRPEAPVWLSVPQGEAAAPYALDAATHAPLAAQIREEILRLTR